MLARASAITLVSVAGNFNNRNSRVDVYLHAAASALARLVDLLDRPTGLAAAASLAGAHA